MQLHEKIFNVYMSCFLITLVVVIGIPITILVRIHGVPLLARFLVDGVPIAIYSVVTDPFLALSALVVFLFLWAAVLTLSGYQWTSSNHRRGRAVQSHRNDEFEDALRRRHRAKMRSIDESNEPQIGVRRPRRFGSFKRENEDED